MPGFLHFPSGHASSFSRRFVMPLIAMQTAPRVVSPSGRAEKAPPKNSEMFRPLACMCPLSQRLFIKISTSDRTHARSRNAKDTETKPNARKDRTQAFTE